jgi:hypothetical protein
MSHETLAEIGGRGTDRTCDPYDVNVALPNESNGLACSVLCGFRQMFALWARNSVQRTKEHYDTKAPPRGPDLGG